jgi:hypothetical protein
MAAARRGMPGLTSGNGMLASEKTAGTTRRPAMVLSTSLEQESSTRNKAEARGAEAGGPRRLPASGASVG